MLPSQSELGINVSKGFERDVLQLEAKIHQDLLKQKSPWNVDTRLGNYNHSSYNNQSIVNIAPNHEMIVEKSKKQLSIPSKLSFHPQKQYQTILAYLDQNKTGIVPPFDTMNSGNNDDGNRQVSNQKESRLKQFTNLNHRQLSHHSSHNVSYSKLISRNMETSCSVDLTNNKIYKESNNPPKNLRLTKSLNFNGIQDADRNDNDMDNSNVPRDLLLDDPLYQIVQEERKYKSSLHSTNRLDSSDIRQLGQFESPPPELWVTARICFLLLTQYFKIKSSDNILKSSSITNIRSSIFHESDQLICSHDHFHVCDALRQHYHNINSKEILNSLDLFIASESFTWHSFKAIIFCDDFIPIIDKIDKMCNQSLQLSMNDNINNLTDMEITYFSSFHESEISLLRELSKSKSFHPSSCEYFSSSATRLCLWTRRAVGAIYNFYSTTSISTFPNSSSNPITNNDEKDFNFRSSGSWLESHHRSEDSMSRKQWHDSLSYQVNDESITIRKRRNIKSVMNMNSVICLHGDQESFYSIALPIIKTLPSFSQLDILVVPIQRSYNLQDDGDVVIVPVEKEEKKDCLQKIIEARNQAIEQLKCEIQQLSLSPSHRVFDLEILSSFQSSQKPLASTMTIKNSSNSSNNISNNISNNHHIKPNGVITSFSSKSSNHNHVPLLSANIPFDLSKSQTSSITVQAMITYIQFQANADWLFLPKNLYEFEDMKVSMNENSRNKDDMSCGEVFISSQRFLPWDIKSKDNNNHHHHHIGLLTSNAFQHHSYNHMIVFVSDTNSKSQSVFQFASTILKPFDMLTIAHIQIPSVKDLQHIESMECHGIDIDYDKLLDTLLNHSKTRKNRLEEYYRQRGFNLLVGDELTAIEILQLYESVITNNQKHSYYKYLSQRMNRIAESINANYVIMGSSNQDVHSIAITGLQCLIEDRKSNRFVRSFRNTVVSMLESCTTSILLVGDDE